MLIKEIMRTPVFTTYPEATLREAAERMLEHGVNGLPVVDEQEQVVGIVGLKDILRAPIPSLANGRVSRQTQIDELARHLETTSVERVMATTVWSVKEDDDVMKAIVIMVNQGLHPLPVLRERKLVGVVSRADAVRAVLASEPHALEMEGQNVHDHLLNENQKRSVTVTLRLFEERLAEVERMLTVEERGILYERVAHFSPQQIRILHAQIDQARAAIREMAHKFNLQRETQEPTRRIFGLLSITWESLEELHSKSLKAYGAVDPRLPEVIDPSVEELTRLAMDIRHTALYPPEAREKVDESESA